MPTFQRCDERVNAMADELLCEFATHQPLLDAKVKIDFVFAFPDYDEDSGEPINDALRKNGCKALGICRKLALKDRALGRGDAEISLDGEWWRQSDNSERRALLDHELHHLDVKRNKDGTAQRDDLGRPILKLRPHDHEFGWFEVIAARHGVASQERIQARRIMEQSGQFYWPDLCQPTEAKAA